MAVTVNPVTKEFVAEIGDIDLAKPVSSSDLVVIKESFTHYAILIFPDQRLTQEQHIEFAKNFGPLEISISTFRKDDPKRMSMELANVSNLGADEKPLPNNSRIRGMQKANLLWHTDSSFKDVPALASLLYARSIPPVGGLTEFADMRAAYEALSNEIKLSLKGLVAEHSYLHSRSKIGFTQFTKAERKNLPPALQVLVRTGPESGRTSLYLASHIVRILDYPEEKGRKLVKELIKHATQRQFIYTHRWRCHDLVMWDNRCTMHRGREYSAERWPRDMQRATVSDIANTCVQFGINPAAAQ